MVRRMARRGTGGAAVSDHDWWLIPLLTMVGLVLPSLLFWFVPRIAVPDWDEVMMLAMGFAGLAYVIADLKRERKLDTHAVDFAARLAALEANADDSLAIEGRIAKLEMLADRDERFEERLAVLGERIAALETWRDLEDA